MARAIWGLQSIYGNIPNVFAHGRSVRYRVLQNTAFFKRNLASTELLRKWPGNRSEREIEIEREREREGEREREREKEREAD